MSMHQKSINGSALMRQLNSLLNALRIPIPLQSPTELTPSLLIAILESLLSERITYADTLENKDLQNTKIFLGVLETDVLKTDVGLSNLDPCKLAAGSLEECVHVAELLCWIGRRLKYISGDDPFELDGEAPSFPYDIHSPSTTITTRESLFTSTYSTHYASDSNTSIDSAVPRTPTPKPTPRATPRPRARCIHEISSPSVVSPPRSEGSITLQREFSNAYSPQRKPNVRRTGYISPVDQDLELLSFEQSRSLTSRTPSDEGDEVDTTFSLTALRESTSRTLALYQERARLLEEMARLQSQSFRSP